MMRVFLKAVFFRPSCQDIPLGDAPQGPNLLSPLVQTATSLADK